MTFGEKVKTLRTTKKMSQAQLAQELGVALRTVSGWENQNRYPKKRELYQNLADILGCDISYLMSEEESFITEASEQYGSRGAKQAQQLTVDVTGLFAGGEMAQEDMDVMMKAIQDAYWIAKEKNKKYTPKKYRSED